MFRDRIDLFSDIVSPWTNREEKTLFHTWVHPDEHVMIKFFRKIRQQLLVENRLSKYLLYAIGEIVLVVIGILIALKINNWNTENQNRNLESEIITEIHDNLLFDLEELRSDIRHMDSLNTACEFMIDYIKLNQNPSEKFTYEAAKLRIAPHFDPNKSGYTLLTSKGVETIVNDSLRRSISILYETKYPYYHKYEAERIQYRQLYTMPITEQYFTMIPRPELTYKGEFRISPQDYEVLRNDASFHKMLTTVIYENALVQSRANSIVEYILELLEQLNKEKNK